MLRCKAILVTEYITRLLVSFRLLFGFILRKCFSAHNDSGKVKAMWKIF